MNSSPRSWLVQPSTCKLRRDADRLRLQHASFAAMLASCASNMPASPQCWQVAPPTCQLRPDAGMFGAGST
jgi:hypothetical protein